MRKFLISYFFLISALSYATNYYVNNGSLAGDIYCSAVGAAGNNGTSASTPKASISNVLTTYALVPGDIIYVDAGTYSDYINPGTNDNGSSVAYVKIIGAGASKTTIGCTSASNTFNFVATKYMWVEGMTINAETSSNLLTTFYLSNNADYNIIAKCAINGPSTTTGWSNGSVQNNYALGLSSSSSANIPDFNSVISCTISAKKYGIYCKGHSTTAAEMADGNEFADNIIEISNPATSGTFEANNYIYFTKNTKILRNKFRDFFTAIYFSNKSGSTTNDNINAVIANNYFTNLTTKSYLHCVIHIFSALTATANIKIYNNSFYMENGTYGCYHSEHVSGPLGVSIMNNLFSVPSNGGGSSIFTFDSNPGTNKFTSCDYNYYDCDVIDYIAYNYNGSDRATLTNWQAVDHDAGAGNGDANSSETSVLGAPGFVDESIGNLDLIAASPMYSNCAVYNGLANDIRSMARPTTGTTPHAFGAYDNGTQILAAEFISLTGTHNTDNNLLNWQTAAEENNSHFEIEKSSNAIDFVLIAKQPTKWLGSKQASVFNYHYEDELSNAYYRLKQVDTDGSFTYSKIIYIGSQKANATLSLSPNPSNGLVKISNQFTENTKVKITVYDLFGRLLLETEMMSDTNDIPLSLNHLDAGWYQIIIANEGTIFQEKILLLDK